MYWPAVTARHLLTHTSGLGKVPPGTQFEQLGDAEDPYCLDLFVTCDIVGLGAPFEA